MYSPDQTGLIAQIPIPLCMVVLLAALAGCTSDSVPGLTPSSSFAKEETVRNGRLDQGVASGDVTSESALVWFRTTGPAWAQVEWASEGDLQADGSPDRHAKASARSPIMAMQRERDLTATVRLEGLVPATRYRYRILTAEVDGNEGFQEKAREAGAGWFQTAAVAEKPEVVTFLWGADLGGQLRCRDERTGYAIFNQMLRVGPAFLLLLGDTIYGDNRCPSPPNVPGGDFLASTVDEFRVKHRYQRGDPALRRFLAAIPVYAIWDDHEVRNNFAGPSEPLMPLGRQALVEYWPIGTPPEDPFRFYRKIRRGADLELFILDTRQYRSTNAEPDGPGKTMLGATQRAWLLDELARSTATWKVIATSVPLSNPKPGTLLTPGNDSWARGADGTGFQTELRAIVSEIMGRRIRNVVWLAADVHYAQVNAYDPDGDGKADFHEFICGPLSANPKEPAQPDATFRPTTLYSEGGFMNFGVVTVEGSRLRLEIVDEAGTSRFAQSFAAQQP